jgi:hypothetical protein
VTFLGTVVWLLGYDLLGTINIFSIFFLGAFAKLRKTTISFVMFVCLSVYLSFPLPAWNNSAAMRPYFIKADILIFSEKLLRKF